MTNSNVTQRYLAFNVLLNFEIAWYYIWTTMTSYIKLYYFFLKNNPSILFTNTSNFISSSLITNSNVTQSYLGFQRFSILNYQLGTKFGLPLIHIHYSITFSLKITHQFYYMTSSNLITIQNITQRCLGFETIFNFELLALYQQFDNNSKCHFKVYLRKVSTFNYHQSNRVFTYLFIH